MAADDGNGRIEWLKDDLAAIRDQLTGLTAIHGKFCKELGKHEVRIENQEDGLRAFRRMFYRLAGGMFLLLVAAVVGVYV